MRQECTHSPPPAPTGIVSLLLLIYLVFTSFWPISALYLAWIIFDWDTPEKGGDGHRSHFPPALQQNGAWGPLFPWVHPSMAIGEHHIPPAPSFLSPIIIPMVGRGMRWVWSVGSVFRGSHCLLGWASSPVIPPWFAGGRRLPCLRRWTVWRHFRDYFPVKVQCREPGSQDGMFMQVVVVVIPAKRACHCYVHTIPFIATAGEDTRPVPQPQLHHWLPPSRHPLRWRLLQLHHGLHGL